MHDCSVKAGDKWEAVKWRGRSGQIVKKVASLDMPSWLAKAVSILPPELCRAKRTLMYALGEWPWTVLREIKLSGLLQT